MRFVLTPAPIRGQRATPNNTAHFGELAAKAAYGIGKGMEQWHEGR